MPDTDILDRPGRSTYRLWRPANLKAHREHGWDSNVVRRALGAGLGSALKAVADTTSLGPLLRDDMEEANYELFIKLFPLADIFPKSEASGTVDEFRRKLAFSSFGPDQPLSVAENGQLVEDRSKYQKDYTPIPIWGSVRGESIKAQLGARASGVPDPADDEINDGITNCYEDFQTEAFRFQNVTEGLSATSQFGAYDATGMKGFRYITEVQSPGSNIRTVDVTTLGSDGGYAYNNDAITNAVSEVAGEIQDSGGGMPDLMLGSTAAREYLRREAQQHVRYIGAPPRTEIIPGVVVPSFTLGNGDNLPYYAIPGKTAMGSYSIAGSGTYIDLVIVDSSKVRIKWLGAPGPMVLDLPAGVDRTLRKTSLVFWMAALQVVSGLSVGKVRIKISNSTPQA
jgi:hypothetical protein